MIYQAIAYCVEPGCRCLDRSGRVLYAGPDRQEAELAAVDQCPAGYEAEVVTRPDGAGRRY